MSPQGLLTLFFFSASQGQLCLRLASVVVRSLQGECKIMIFKGQDWNILVRGSCQAS